MSSIRDRFRMAWPTLRYRAKLAIGSYFRLVGICLLAGGALVGSVWTWAVLLSYVHAWPF